MTTPPRIYADFNGYLQGEDYDGVELDTLGTLADLHYQQIKLTEGLQLMAWDGSDDEEDLEVTGSCHFHRGSRPHWYLAFPRGSLSYVKRRHQSTPPLLCFRCRYQIADASQHPKVQACPSCGLSLHFPWQQPLNAET